MPPIMSSNQPIRYFFGVTSSSSTSRRRRIWECYWSSRACRVSIGGYCCKAYRRRIHDFVDLRCMSQVIERWFDDVRLYSSVWIGVWVWQREQLRKFWKKKGNGGGKRILYPLWRSSSFISLEAYGWRKDDHRWWFVWRKLLFPKELNVVVFFPSSRLVWYRSGNGPVRICVDHKRPIRVSVRSRVTFNDQRNTTNIIITSFTRRPIWNVDTNRFSS